MERYAEYRDSGVAWIGEIPAGWELTRLKRECSLAGRIGWQGLTSDEYQDEGPYLITGVDFRNGSIDWASCVHISDARWEEASQIQIQDDDLLITKDGTVGKVAMAENIDDKASLNSGVMVIRPLLDNHKYTQRYLFWVLQSQEFWGWFNEINAGNSTIIHLYQGDFVNFPFTLPSICEQRAIAAWLDEKMCEVDGLVADTERSIELLEEYRRSVISEAVTKGLDPSAPMKDSGVEWIGEIPAGWDTVALKRLATIQSGATPDRERSDYWGGEIGWIKTGELQDCVIESAEERITEAALAETAVVRFPKDTVLVAMYGQGKTRGMTGLLGFESTTNQACAGIIADDNQLLPRFLWWFMRGSYRAIREEALGSGQPNLSVGLISSWKVTVPPLAEQQAIAAHLDEATAAINSLIADKHAYAERLREYRKSLISEAVTGKFKVPGVE